MSNTKDEVARGVGYLLCILALGAFLVACIAAGVVTVGYSFVLDSVPWYARVSMAFSGLFVLWRFFTSIVTVSRKRMK